MESLGMFKAKTHLPEIIRNVQKGQVYVLTNRSREVAVIMSIEEYKKNFKPFDYNRLKNVFSTPPFSSAEEIISMRDEGRK